jgi:hypothetical protein
MDVSGDDLNTVYNCVSAVMRSHRANRRQIPYSLQRIYDRLDLQVRVMSRAGHEIDSASEESDPWMSTQDAARELELSPRQTRRLKKDLGGEKPNGRLMFRASAVRSYAEGRRNGRA